MPLYEYRCEACGHVFEKIQKFSDARVSVCPKCGSGPVEKLASSPAIQFKGAGFYITDYARKDQDKGKDRGEKAEKAEKAEKGEKAEKAEKGEPSKSSSDSSSTSDSASKSTPATSDSSSSSSSTPSTPTSTSSTTPPAKSS